MLLNHTVLFIIWMLFPLCLTAQNIPRSYVAYSTNEPIDIDGTAREPSWEKAKWSSDFIDIQGLKKPTYRTRMKMLWDTDYLYFYAQMEEPHIWGTLKQRDTVIFYNNDFEIFIDPDGDTHDYIEFEMNALNTIWDLFLTEPYRNAGKVLDNWDIQGLKTAVHINGTLNDSTDEDIDWSVEIAMPWSVLTEAHTSKEPPKNDFWRFNFSRVNWDYQLHNGRYARKTNAKGEFLPEYNWVWSPQGVVNMHEPERWGYIYFSDKNVGTTEIFEIPKDEHIKWALYKSYKNLLNAGEDFDKVKAEILNSNFQILDVLIDFQMDANLSRWNISTVSPFSNHRLSIDEDGKFKSYEKQK